MRGSLAIAVLSAAMLLTDLVQRTIIVLLVRLRPSSRDEILTRWLMFLARMVLGIARSVGGANITDPPRIPSGPGVLILMNHQSLFDIPLAVRSVEGLYPRIVTRRRYASGKPLLSHLLKIYRFPLVDPGRAVRPQVSDLAQAAEAPHPLILYPEGTRSKTGEIGPFKTLGLSALLSARQWSVYVLVVDGLWRCGRFPDLIANLPTVRARTECLGPFSSPAPGQDAAGFVEEVRARMCDKLAEMRGARGLSRIA